VYREASPDQPRIEEDGMKARRFTTAAPWVAILCLILLLSACGEESASTDSKGASSGGAPGGRSKPALYEAGSAESVMAEDMPESGGAEAGSAGTLTPTFGRKIVKSADLGLRADDVREAATRAQQVAAQFGGSIQSSQISRGDGFVSAYLVLSVPSERFEAALDELRGLGEEVTTDAVTGEDVTEEFVDLESRERNLLAAEESLLNLYDRAESVDDALEIERELANIRGQIEQVQGRIKYLEQRTDLSQIALNIQPTAEPIKSPPDWSPARVAAQAWSASLGVLQALATAAISAVVFGWWLAPVLVAGFLLWRRRGQRPVPPDPPAATGS
jgi:hypothetical protein